MKLELLGLNAYEARVLETLSRLGKASASKVSMESEVPYGRIYDVLNTLVSKSFVKLLPGPTKQYAAVDPKLLLHKLEERKKELIELEGDIVKLKEEYKSSGEEPVWVIHGKRNFYKAIDKMPWPKKYDYAVRYTVEPNPAWIGNLKRLINKGVKVRALVRNVPETEDAVEKWKKAVPKMEMRQFNNNDGIAMELVDDEIMWFSLIKKNTLTLIQDPSFVKLMRQLFEAKWKESERV